ncbi:hypothetical protein ACO2Q2_09050 [Dyella sp. KRB-257]|uniref:hypothetical protein n=1 Tax=Dyella sp. KRB-257 TaxID=3400915 RepID=UPI003C10791B
MNARAMLPRDPSNIARDIIEACRRLGDLGAAVQYGAIRPDSGEIVTTVEGLQRVLVEYRVEVRQ